MISYRQPAHAVRYGTITRSSRSRAILSDLDGTAFDESVVNDILVSLGYHAGLGRTGGEEQPNAIRSTALSAGPVLSRRCI